MTAAEFAEIEKYLTRQLPHSPRRFIVAQEFDADSETWVGVRVIDQDRDASWFVTTWDEVRAPLTAALLPTTWEDIAGASGTTPEEELGYCRRDGITPEAAAEKIAHSRRLDLERESDAPNLDWDEWERGAAAVALREIAALITDGRYQLLQHKSSGELFVLDTGCNRICGALEQREVYDEDHKMILDLAACDFGQADGEGAGPYTPETDDELYELLADQY